MRLAHKTAIVTGASSGIGRAIALRYAAEGANVLVSDVREDPIWDGESDLPTHRVIRERGGQAQFVRADVASSAEVAELFAIAVASYARVDVVVNNAAIFDSAPIVDTVEEDWDRLMSINLGGQFLVARSAIRQMLEQEPVNEVRGRVINMSSQHGFIGSSDRFAYGVAKGGTVNMTRQLAVDYGRRGILVNALAPGRILTRATTEAEAAATDPTVTYAQFRTPFHRLGRVSDIEGPAVFLASDDCTYVSGHNLVIDGGWLAH